ncbi:GNAT family N-acetyltransferase [Micromonospora sp. ATA51]|uniref:GNAT family N-acetyltransferase n=1 Tax=Micromonospora sp. ATA51 TaxID=2806098 RepID=UPI001A3D305C|nr:GNAT family N-acetyltransferase [Micromonospora sp. ATA51]MBM0225765.1 GNAT family N-acetyltransferase [Micromonospora sp. ATA51]
MTTWTTSPTHPDEPEAAILLREYLTEMVRRYHRRPERPGEVDAALAESPSDDLTPPTGLLLLAHHDGELAGCAGLRWRLGWATRSDPVEARTLYARHGYVEIPAYNNGRYAEHWFEKALPAGVDDTDPARYINN